ncbi:DUF4493 domain-containing protein [Proteiniphilum sp. UBA5384]|uniref:DUF4493 domain-containing protein n=1 Tax=Proteiniphilum sp. UBA5384 TaxID=1947279 RepID=UPI0025F5CEBC|nr:DUF4493 domain-containing protein [Proteiniphilum sp. UBA5384]
MKRIYKLLALLTAVCLFSCQNEDIANDKGYLRLIVDTNVSVNVTRGVGEEYNPKQIAISIVDASGKVVESTDDWTTLAGKQLEMTPGTYTINASSNGFDGAESGFDIPYYAGTTQVTVEKDKEVTASVTCTLANVKVTVHFDQTFIAAFKSATATVASELPDIASQAFVMGETARSAYFPVGDLTSTIAVVNKSDQPFSQTDKITGVKARDHYILHYKVAETGEGGVTVNVDDTETTYTFEFVISSQLETKLQTNVANAWSNFAYLEGKVVSAAGELDPDNMVFAYKADNASEWSTIAASKEGENNFKATLKGLLPNTDYSYRLKYSKDGEEYEGNPVSFTTETEIALVNGNLDDWYQSGKTWYAASEAYFTANGGSFWDSSNPGTTTGAGALINKNPTQGNSSVVHTAGGKSASLQSQYASFIGIGKFAAASLYTGNFVKLVGTNGAKINFGQPFAARPTQLHGWFRYATEAMDYVGSNTPASLGIEKGKTPDVCAIYIALTTNSYEVDNTNVATFIDFENDAGIIAYGELPASDAVPTGDAWKEFTIDLKYRDLETKPTHIIVVCSASKYGDYFTGSTKSLMYVDDLALVYGDSPISQ